MLPALPPFLPISLPSFLPINVCLFVLRQSLCLSLTDLGLHRLDWPVPASTSGILGLKAGSTRPNMCCSCRGLKLRSQHPHQPSVIQLKEIQCLLISMTTYMHTRAQIQIKNKQKTPFWSHVVEQLFWFYSYLFILCVCVHTFHSKLMKASKQLPRIFLLPCRLPGSNSGHQAWV